MEEGEQRVPPTLLMSLGVQQQYTIVALRCFIAALHIKVCDTGW